MADKNSRLVLTPEPAALVAVVCWCVAYLSGSGPLPPLLLWPAPDCPWKELWTGQPPCPGRCLLRAPEREAGGCTWGAFGLGNPGKSGCSGKRRAGAVASEPDVPREETPESPVEGLGVTRVRFVSAPNVFWRGWLGYEEGF